jgi:hypothetical protein
MHPEKFRLAVVAVPNDPKNEPSVVSYHVQPFKDVKLHFAQTYVPLSVTALREHAVKPQ